MPREYKCPCGRAWPCPCDSAREVMGLGRRSHPEDDLVAAVVRCPQCGENVLLELDPEDVVAWESETLIVQEVGPEMGHCCGYIFVAQPDGEVLALRDQ